MPAKYHTWRDVYLEQFPYVVDVEYDYSKFDIASQWAQESDDTTGNFTVVFVYLEQYRFCFDDERSAFYFKLHCA